MAEPTEPKDTDEQERAADDDNHNVAILASAGSGKTRTLVQRICKEVIDGGTTPSNIIAFTFTNRAADDLRAKVHRKLAGKVDEAEFARMYVGTIHGYCNQLLKECDAYTNFDVLDDYQLESLVFRLHDELGLTKVYGFKMPENVRRFILDYEIFENELLTEHDLPTKVRKPISHFAELLVKNRLLTFGSMIRSAIEVIESKRGLEELVHLFVDEYQDINPAQERLITSMTAAGAKLSVVGDDLQSIYQWRGSDVQRILQFAKRWKGETHILSANFRSRKDIVELADKFSKSIEPRYTEKEKSMRPVLGDFGLKNVHWLRVSSESNQAEQVVTLVERALSQGYSPRDIAILLRSVKTSAPPILHELTSREVPFYCPLISVLDQATLIVMARCMFRLLSMPLEARNPTEEKAMDELGEKFSDALRRLQPSANDRNTGLGVYEEWKEALHAGKPSTLNIRQWLYKFLEAAKVEWGNEDQNLLVQMGILSRLIRSVEETNRRTIKGVTRKKPGSVYAHLAYLLEDQEEDALPIDEPPRDVNAVLVTTVHQAKGLEWPVVILPSLAYMRFPIPPRKHESSFPDSIAHRYGTAEVDERRLFYVALTRAMDHLVLASFENKGRVSRFLVPDNDGELLKPIKTMNEVSFSKKERPSSASETLTGIGISDLIMLLECPFQFELRRVHGIYPQVGDELGYGRSMHEIIERSMRGGKWRSDQEIQDLSKEYTHIPLESPSRQEIHKDTIAKSVASLKANWNLPSFGGSEIPVSFVLDEVEVRGAVDTYSVDKNGSISLIDWKSSIHEEFSHRYEMQMQLYTYGLRKQGKDVSDCWLIDVKDTRESGSLAKSEVDVSEKAVSTLITETKTYLKKLRSRQFEPRPSKATCSSCDVNTICKYAMT